MERAQREGAGSWTDSFTVADARSHSTMEPVGNLHRAGLEGRSRRTGDLSAHEAFAIPGFRLGPLAVAHTTD